jgi:predicted metal-dependent hydrolase
MPSDDFNIASAYEAGLCRARAGEYFAAHEAFEAAWLLANPAERDFFQGLVHAVVFAYQAGRGKTIGAERQREKALRRLTPYAPVHRNLELGQLLGALRGAETDLREHLVERDPQPPVAVEEEQQAEHDKCRS